MKQIVMILLYSIAFTSCDPGLINNYVVDNQSDYSVEAKVRLQEGHRRIHETDTIQIVKIKPKSKIEIIDYGQIGSAHDKKQHFLEAFDTISIQSNGIPFKKRVRERNNWSYRVISEGLLSMDEVEYIFVINNEAINE